MKTFAHLLRRQTGAPDQPQPLHESLDEQYEVLDSGAFWDETAEVLAPDVALAS